MALRIERVLDEEMARAWHAVDEVVVPFDHPGLLADPLGETLAYLPDGTRSMRMELYVGFEDSTPVATSRAFMPIPDNTHVAHVSVDVLPELRRRGLGRQMFEHLAGLTKSAGRTLLAGLAGGPDTRTVPGNEFALALGARKVQASRRYELTLKSLDRARIARIVEEAQRGAAGYEIITWIDSAPEEFVDDLAALMARMSTDSPTGEADWRPETWNAARWRETEDEVKARDRVRIATGALHVESNRLIAHTDIAVPRSRPLIAYQWDTIVDPDHRGHRLGALIKAANLALLERTVAGVEVVETWNAVDNPHMVGINDAMGFRPVETETWWELDL